MGRVVYIAGIGGGICADLKGKGAPVQPWKCLEQGGCVYSFGLEQVTALVEEKQLSLDLWKGKEYLALKGDEVLVQELKATKRLYRFEGR